MAFPRITNHPRNEAASAFLRDQVIIGVGVKGALAGLAARNERDKGDMRAMLPRHLQRGFDLLLGYGGQIQKKDVVPRRLRRDICRPLYLSNGRVLETSRKPGDSVAGCSDNPGSKRISYHPFPVACVQYRIFNALRLTVNSIKCLYLLWGLGNRSVIGKRIEAMVP